MRTILPFLVCLMLVLTSWTGVAHASETRPVEASPIAMISHVAGDADEVPADADKGYPHHHAGCHDHFANTPGLGDFVAIARTPADALPIFYRKILIGTVPDAALRPPQA